MVEPTFAARKSVADETATDLLRKLTARGLSLDPQGVEQLGIEATRAFILHLVSSGRLSLEEVEVWTAEYKVARLDAAYREHCNRPKKTKLAVARKTPPEQIAPILLARGQ